MSLGTGLSDPVVPPRRSICLAGQSAVYLLLKAPSEPCRASPLPKSPAPNYEPPDKNVKRLTNRIRPTIALVSISCLVSLLSTGLSPSARACSTPVFRYAMYNWPTAPYYFFYFHDGQIPEEDKAIHEQLEKLATADKPSNVRLTVIDVTNEEQLKYIPEVVLKSREAQAKDNEPLFVVYTSWGAELYVGKLDAEMLGTLVDSPMRQQIAKRFHQGNATVMLILKSSDEKANKEAAKVARQLVAKAKAGEIVVSSELDYMMPPPPPAEGSDGESAEDQPPAEPEPEKMKIAVLELSRDDANEKWLLRSLLAVEPDLDKFADKPMVFAMYGRGRVLPPYIGKGIHVDNLVDCASFLGGACSCMIKDQNPGVDLLMQWDWDSTAEAWAEKQGEFGGGPDPFGYQEYGPGR